MPDITENVAPPAPPVIQIISYRYRRENSESQFSADKRTTGGRIQQRREDRIRTAAMCKGTWHNLFNMTSG